MDLIFNDCSVYGQFRDLSTFRESIERVMAIRNLARRMGRDLQCHRSVASALVMPNCPMPRAIQSLGRERQRAIMQWLTRHGPFWEDDRRHSGLDWFECKGEIVTDTAIGEAAFCLHNGIERGVVSICPSTWMTPRLAVSLREEGHPSKVEVPNYWDVTTVEDALTSAPKPFGSWDDLAHAAHARFDSLTFSNDSFRPLRPEPFNKGAADRLLLRLDILHQLKSSLNDRGQRTPEARKIHQMHFTGKRAWFSDSSDREKARFRSGLTFPHPTNTREFLFCSWHGKVNTPRLRIHFSWPIRAKEPLYIVYIGPKITKL